MQVEKPSVKGVQSSSNVKKNTYTMASNDTPANFVMTKTHPLHEGRIIKGKIKNG